MPQWISIIFFIGLVYWIGPIGFKAIARFGFLRIIGVADNLFLTFDDGPDPRATPAILDLLKEYDARATFFVLGQNVEAHPEIIERIVGEGHELGEHSYRHTHAWKSWPWTTLADLHQGSKSLDRYVTKGMPRWLRPPYGKLNAMSFMFCSVTRKPLAFWNNDPRDYECESGEDVSGRVIDALNEARIVLLHDGRRGKGKSPQATVEATRIILAEAKKRNLNVVTLSEGLKKSRSQ